MRDKIISYREMCDREATSLQRGMNFKLHGKYSVILMSLRPNAPYRDSVEEDGAILIYEGHNHPKNSSCPEPKRVDQPKISRSGTLTENGKFHLAAQLHSKKGEPAELVKVYEKIKSGI